MYLALSIIAAVSIVSGLFALAIRPTHRRMQFALSFVGGVMVGMALLEFIPEAAIHGDIDRTMLSVLGGFFGLFLLERFIPSHCHDIAEGDSQSCSHDHQITWAGAAFGLTVHALLEGAAIAAAWHAGGSALGMGVAAVVLLHKPFDALTLVATMRLQEIKKSKIILANVFFGLTVFGGSLAMMFMGQVSSDAISVVLGIAAGMFLCIALTDLLPELHFHGHDKLGLTLALLLGLGVSYGITLTHSHDHAHQEHQHHDHTHDNHDHDHDYDYTH